MANINLLPWRDHYREEKKKEFLAILVAICIVSGLASYLWVSVVEAGIASQEERNRILQTEISGLEKKVAEINELKQRRQELLSRMKVIQGLQGTRPIIVRYFDELARAIPDGVHLQKLERVGNLLMMEGIAESNNRVSSLMRNLDQSEWFAAPNLTSVKADPDYGEQANAFKMSVSTSAPKDQEKKET